MTSTRGRAAEESIYNLAGLDLADALGPPRVKTLKVAAPSGQPTVRMHQDSSQVRRRGGWPTAGMAQQHAGPSRRRASSRPLGRWPQVSNIFNPVKGPRDAMIRAGIKPPNHAQKNVGAVKEQSKLNALKKLQASQGPASASCLLDRRRRRCTAPQPLLSAASLTPPAAPPAAAAAGAGGDRAQRQARRQAAAGARRLLGPLLCLGRRGAGAAVHLADQRQRAQLCAGEQDRGGQQHAQVGGGRCLVGTGAGALRCRA
jgi:hypothetical protein